MVHVPVLGRDHLYLAAVALIYWDDLPFAVLALALQLPPVKK